MLKLRKVLVLGMKKVVFEALVATGRLGKGIR